MPADRGRIACYWAVAAFFAGLAVSSPSAAQGPASPPVKGYADLHVHQFTDLSMAGAWLYGSAVGPEATSLARCSGNVPLAPGRDHGAFDLMITSVLVGPVWATLAGHFASEMAGSDTGLHAGRRHGYCQADFSPPIGMCEGSLACNALGKASCAPTSVCAWRSIGTACRDKPNDGFGLGFFCNVARAERCGNTCSFKWSECRGNLACNFLSKSDCHSSVCSMQSLGSICRDRGGDGKSVGLACNTLGPAACAASCSWNPQWGSVNLHPEERRHDWSNRQGDEASWPAWDAIAHQQVHSTWLHRAYQDGLRLMVMSALNNEAFCALLPRANRTPGYGCGDLENVVRQLDAALAMGADPRTSWYKIARTPAEARRIVNSGQLAVILSVEASDIFNTADPAATLRTLYDRGVRTLQPLHQFNSKLGGVGWHDGTIKTLQKIKNLPSVRSLCKDGGGHGNFADCDATEGNLNYLGLTGAGQRFVAAMLNLGMPVDIAHMSELSVRDVETLVTAACDYPVYVSHGHVRTLLDEESWKAKNKHEKSVPDWQLDLLRKTGGMFGLRTGPDHHQASAYRASMTAAGVSAALPGMPAQTIGKKDIGGNEFHFAYALDYLHRLKGVRVALGSDLNGLIPQMVFKDEDQNAKLAGLAHIGEFPELFRKVKATGLDSGTFGELRERSAEAYLQMWERAAAFARGNSCCPSLTVTRVTPDQGYFARPRRVTISGSGFTPHASMAVSLRRTSGSQLPVVCTGVEFVSSTSLRCTLPALVAGISYTVTVSNGGCGINASRTSAYLATRLAVGLAAEPPEPEFAQTDLRTALADEGPDGRFTPNPAKVAAVDWSAPAWGEDLSPAPFLSTVVPFEELLPPDEDEGTAGAENREVLAAALDLALAREDIAEIRDPTTMIAACDLEEGALLELAAARGWPANWRAQLSSLCEGRANVCVAEKFLCPGGAPVERVGQRPEATTASCPFDLAATYATCPATDNLALGGQASFSAAPAAGGEAWRAVDGGASSVFAEGSVATAAAASADPWWQVDLGSNATVAALSVLFRTDCCQDRERSFEILTSTDGVAWQTVFVKEPSGDSVLNLGLPSPVVTRFVRLQLRGREERADLAEVKVWGTRPPGLPGSNLAAGQPAAFGTGYYTCHAANAVDRNVGGSTSTQPGCTTAISGNSAGAWWQVDLQKTGTVTAVRIWNRQDCALVGCIDRLRRFAVQTSIDGTRWTTQANHPETLFTFNQQVETVIFPAAVELRFVRIVFEPSYRNFLQLNEVEVLGTGRGRSRS